MRVYLHRFITCGLLILGDQQEVTAKVIRCGNDWRLRNREYRQDLMAAIWLKTLWDLEHKHCSSEVQRTMLYTDEEKRLFSPTLLLTVVQPQHLGIQPTTRIYLPWMNDRGRAYRGFLCQDFYWGCTQQEEGALPIWAKESAKDEWTGGIKQEPLCSQWPCKTTSFWTEV